MPDKAYLDDFLAGASTEPAVCALRPDYRALLLAVDGLESGGSDDISEELRQAADEANAGLAGRGRVLVRPSGTEQLVRVMVEAPSAEEADAVCGRLVAAVERAAAAVA